MRLGRIYRRGEFKKKRVEWRMEIPSLDVSSSGVDGKVLGRGRDL